MLLAIDIGNSNIALGLNDAGIWVHHWRLYTEAKRTADEYVSQLHSLMLQSDIPLQQIDSVIIGSVVPELVATFNEVVDKLIDVQPLIVMNSIMTGLKEGTVPEELGADLLANAVAAHAKFPNKDCMVIDFGTALTCTTVSSEGEIAGVAIAPGVGSAVDALATKTAQLPHVEIIVPESVLGLNTVHAIQAGVIFGYTGLVTSLIEQTESEIGRPLTVIATGGFSKMIAPKIPRIDSIEPWHTLDGLKLLFEMNHA